MKLSQPKTRVTSAPNKVFDARAHGLKLLRQKGFDPASAENILAIDQIFRRWRRASQRRDMMQQTCAALDLDIEATHFEALLIISGLWINMDQPPENQHASPPEVTIGDIASELNIDPSQASRLVSTLVSRAYVKRVASQEDGRKSCLALSGFGQEVINALARLKWTMVSDAFEHWSKKELGEFQRLLEKFASAYGTRSSEKTVRASELEKSRKLISDARLKMNIPDARNQGD